MSHIKYFESSDGKFKGHLRGIVPKVMGAERRAVLRLASLWLKMKKRIGRSSMQLQILDEIAAQLNVFRRYADKIGKTNLGDIYEKQTDLILAIRESKHLLYQKPRGSKLCLQRRAYKTLLDQLSLKFGEKALDLNKASSRCSCLELCRAEVDNLRKYKCYINRQINLPNLFDFSLWFLKKERGC